MGDALCGPSNALQNFQKHTSVDRTLQQDRLTLRQSSSEGFRSAQRPPAGALDPEFDDFQAGFGREPLQPTIQQPPRGLLANRPNASFQPPASQLGWAADFQRLHISASSSSHAQFSAPPPAQQIAQNIPASWHLDFIKSSSPAAVTPEPLLYNRMPFGGLTGYSPAFQPTSTLNSNHIAQDKGKDHALTQTFDDVAFERAFDAAQADLFESVSSADAMTHEHIKMADGRIPEEANPLMRLTWEKQPATYLVVKIWNAFGLSTDGAPFQQDTAQHASAFLQELELLQEQGRLTDEGEILRTKKILHRILQLDQIPQNGEYQFSSRAYDMLGKLEGWPEAVFNAPVPEESLESEASNLQEAQLLETHHEVLQDKQQEPQEPAQDEELARTAGQLLESVSDNTSKKFQESNFLALMRKLRDHEVRVEGDKMIETSPDPVETTRIPTHEQDLDLGRKLPTGPPETGGHYIEPFA